MKYYRVNDLQGCNFMDDTHDDPMTLNDLRQRFWSLDEAHTDRYCHFTKDYIEDMWLVEFEAVNIQGSWYQRHPEYNNSKDL